MVYLIESGNYYKVGYTGNFKQRIQSYNCCNPNYTIIDVIDGDKSDETNLHELLKDYHEKLEWFKRDKAVLKIWNKYKENKKSKNCADNTELSLNNIHLTDLTYKDLLIFVILQSLQNNYNFINTTQDTLCKLSSLSEPTVRKCINNLINLNCINLFKLGNRNIYQIPKCESFMQNYTFLNDPDLSTLEKAFIIYNDLFKTFNITVVSTRDFANKTGLSHSSIIRCQHSLQDKNYLDIIKTAAREKETGCLKGSQIFHLDTLGQAVVFTLMDHEGKINENSEDIYELKQTIKEMKKEMQDIQKAYNIVMHENRELKKKESQEPIIMD